MPRVKQTSRKSTAAKRPAKIPKEIAQYRAATGSTATGPPTDDEYDLAEKLVELVGRRRRYKADAGDRFWDVSLESLEALVFRGATLVQLAGEWEIFGTHIAQHDWESDFWESELVLREAGHLFIGDDGAGVIEISDQPGTPPLSGAFSIEFYKSEHSWPWKRRSERRFLETKKFDADAREWAFFEFDSVEGDSLRWDARGRGPETKLVDGDLVDDVLRVGLNWDMAGKLACGVVHEDVPSMQLLEGDLVVAEVGEVNGSLLFARRRDASVPFPRADFVSMTFKDRALSAALARVRELESERDVVVDLTLDDSNDDAAAPPAKRQTLRDLRDKDVDAKLKEVKQEKVAVEARLDDAMTCIVCQDAPRSVLLSCAHACLCVACANSVTECPICRQNITSRTPFILA
jgi:hypothetical protein